jgi:hypothetical protein
MCYGIVIVVECNQPTADVVFCFLQIVKKNYNKTGQCKSFLHAQNISEQWNYLIA